MELTSGDIHGYPSSMYGDEVVLFTMLMDFSWWFFMEIWMGIYIVVNSGESLIINKYVMGYLIGFIII